MPGAVASAGLCTAVLPLNEIGAYVKKALMRSAA
jgi:two-component system chemotaxis response regulator CheB